MKALAEQISELDGVVLPGRTHHAACGRSGLSADAGADAPDHGDQREHGEN
jgi:hypothetical protein